MNELSNTESTAKNIRKTLLTTASAFALAVSGGSVRAADNDNRPTVWIEGGWHFENIAGKSDLFVPPLDAYNRAAGLPSFTTLEKALGKSYGGEGSVSFQPNGSDWVFAVSGRYSRVRTVRRVQDTMTIVGPERLKKIDFGTFTTITITPTLEGYAAGATSNSESHAIVDFQVGKDIGIGLIGRGTNSIISFGARYAQMNARSEGSFDAHPDARFEQTKSAFLGKYRIRTYNHRSSSFLERTDNVQALGPSLSLKNATGLLGTVDDGQLALDWGVNAALLFGRQKAKNSHHSTVRYFRGGGVGQTLYVQPTVNHSRSHMVTIPNIGGFAGLSYRFPNAKLSAGYRADFFFGARDGGFETRSTADVGFHGPYATISVGFGG